MQSSASGCCLTFAWFFANFSLVLLIKVLLIKKACIGFYKSSVKLSLETRGLVTTLLSLLPKWRQNNRETAFFYYILCFLCEYKKNAIDKQSSKKTVVKIMRISCAKTGRYISKMNQNPILSKLHRVALSIFIVIYLLFLKIVSVTFLLVCF